MSPLPSAPVETRVAVVGASAGGVEALQRLASGLPERLAIPVVVVIHTPEAGASVLPRILQRRTAVPCALTRDGAALGPGLHVAPADHHLLLRPGPRVELSREPREHGLRPAIDRTLRSVADAFGTAGAAVVLSGTRDDGAAGLREVQRAGGRTAVQDPADALFPGMPDAALAAVRPDVVASAVDLGRWLGDPRPGDAGSAPAAELPPVGRAEDHPDGIGTRITCPDCGGVLFETHDGPLAHFACSVGHSYSPATLVAAHADGVEHAMWVAARMLQDRAVLLDGMSRRASETGRERSARTFALQARDAREQHDLIAAVLEREPAASDLDDPEPTVDAA